MLCCGVYGCSDSSKSIRNRSGDDAACTNASTRAVASVGILLLNLDL